jgi:uncharacterized repeat protein (TIGR01451 family)
MKNAKLIILLFLCVIFWEASVLATPAPVNSSEERQKINSSGDHIEPSLDVCLQDIGDSNKKRVMTYKIVVNNTGQAKLKNVRAFYLLPKNASYIKSNCSRLNRIDPDRSYYPQLCFPRFIDQKENGINLTWNLGTFLPDDSMMIFLIVEAREGSVNPQKVRVIASGYFINRTYQTMLERVNCIEAYKTPIESASKQSSNKSERLAPTVEANIFLINIGNSDNNLRAVTYLIDIENIGEAILRNVTVTDTTSSDASFIESSCQRAKQFSFTGMPIFQADSYDIRNISIRTQDRTNISWNLGTLLPNELARITFTIRMREGAFDPLDTQVYVAGNLMGQTWLSQRIEKASVKLWRRTRAAELQGIRGAAA